MLLSFQSTASVLQLFTPECMVFVSDFYPAAQVILSSDMIHQSNAISFTKVCTVILIFIWYFVLGM